MPRPSSQVTGASRLLEPDRVITSADAVLAGTFTALATLPVTFRAELGFAVAFGVLLDTIVVRSVLVTRPQPRPRPLGLVAQQARPRASHRSGHHRRTDSRKRMSVPFPVGPVGAGPPKPVSPAGERQGSGGHGGACASRSRFWIPSASSWPEATDMVISNASSSVRSRT